MNPMLIWIILLLAAPTTYAFIPIPKTRTPSSNLLQFTVSSIIDAERLCWNYQNVYRYKQFFLSKRKNQEDNNDDDVDDDDDDDDDTIDVSDKDWRAFRAKLVLGEPVVASSTETTTSLNPPEPVAVEQNFDDNDLDGIGALFNDISSLQERMTPLDPSQWAYDSGKVIEQGAVILGGVEQDYGFGLRQQYFHKAAILVLEHGPTFTRGIILNRPTDLTLEDNINNEGIQWPIYFGGDVQGLNSENPEIVCLHTIKNNDVVARASVTVMNDIQYTTYDDAQKLVQMGVAQPCDFWVFVGYAGWGPGQLLGEIERKSWYMVATDAQTLLQELQRLSAGGVDPRDAGLDTWSLLMNMMGRSEMAQRHTDGFDDLMLKEWTLENLVSLEAGGKAGMKQQSRTSLSNMTASKSADPVDRLLKRVSAASRGEVVKVGTLVRATSSDRSPFLLEDQGLHKSVILILSDENGITVGVILNRPGTRQLQINVKDNDSDNNKQLKIPMLFGGQYTIKGSDPLLWLHCANRLKMSKVGAPVCEGDYDGIWKCTSGDMMKVVGRGVADPEEFLVVGGVSVWTKGGIQEEIDLGRFEVVPTAKTEAIWELISRQKVLTSENLSEILSASEQAWREGGSRIETNRNEIISRNFKLPIMGGGRSEGSDDDDDDESNLVFKSNVKVSQLSDEALRSWVATFILGDPSL